MGDDGGNAYLVSVEGKKTTTNESSTQDDAAAAAAGCWRHTMIRAVSTTRAARYLILTASTRLVQQVYRRLDRKEETYAGRAVSRTRGTSNQPH